MWLETTPSYIVIGVAVVASLFLWILIRITPGVAPPAPERRSYSPEEIASHDRYLPKYFLAATVAVVLGGLHMVVKNYPPLYRWLYEAGYAGLMVRDLANIHIIIVGGGTLLVAAMTWYVLPRVIQRPLYSDNLAHLAFWLTTAGVFSFYFTLSYMGLLEGALVRHGWYWIAARDHIGIYQELPLAFSSSIMGMGYWCFVGNVMLSLRAGRLVPTPKPDGHLGKFFFMGAFGLLVGTIQGVIQVQPDKVVWLHHVGMAGDFIDPISHAHVNMVTGVCSLIAGITFYFLPRIAPGAQRDRREENRVFWLLTTGSLLFYVTFLSMGLIEGNMEMNTHRNFFAVARSLGPLHAVPLAVAGTAMIIGFWYFIYALGRHLVKPYHGRRSIPARFILAGLAALVVGTFQGPIQAFAPVELWMARAGDAGDAIAQAHALLNISGGVMVILLGLSLVLLPELTGRPIGRRLPMLALGGVWIGTFLYYAIALPFSIAQGGVSQHVANIVTVLRPDIPLEPSLLMVAGALVTVGFAAYALEVYLDTAPYRSEAVVAAQALPGRYAGHIHRRVRQRGLVTTLLIEFAGGLAGFPGAGWLYTGRALQGTLLLIAGPGLAWAWIPAVFTPYGGFLSHYGVAVLFVYLPLSAAISATVLGVVHGRQLRRGVRPKPRRRAWQEEAGLVGWTARDPMGSSLGPSVNVQLAPGASTPGEE